MSRNTSILHQLFLAILLVVMASALTNIRDSVADEISLHAHQSEFGDSTIDTRELVSRAKTFLSILSETEQEQLLYPIDSPQWKVWSNFNHSSSRVGLRIGSLTEAKFDSVLAVLRSALSTQGLDNVTTIMKLNSVLGLMRKNTERFNEDNYFLIMFGLPDANSRWGFQLEGHHLALHYAVKNDEVVMSPVFGALNL